MKKSETLAASAVPDVGIVLHDIRIAGGGGIRYGLGYDDTPGAAASSEEAGPTEIDIARFLERSTADVSPATKFDAMQVRASLALLTLLGLSTDENDDVLLMNKIRSGFAVSVIDNLRAAGVPAAAIYEVVAPKRTIMRRKQHNEPLTPVESDGVYRLARIFAFAGEVLAGSDAALGWLGRSKAILGGMTPWQACASCLGFDRAVHLLWQLESGNLA